MLSAVANLPVTMRYRRLGNSDLEVSEIGLGSWLTYGVSVGREQAAECIRQAFELGINFFDTANMYGAGATEFLLGELLARYRRDSYILATKVYYPMSPGDRGLSAAQIRKQIDASLKRLQTDYVDLYQCHAYDVETPLEETLSAMCGVVEAGKARYIGFCNWKPRQVEAATKLGIARELVSSQPQYSMLHRKPERRLFPLCSRLGIGQVVWSPLAQGVLAGKYLTGLPAPVGSGNRRAGRSFRRFTRPAVLDAVEQLRPIAERCSLTLSQLALAWVLRKPEIASAITGASGPQQIVENAGAAGVSLDESCCREIDRVLAGVIRR